MSENGLPTEDMIQNWNEANDHTADSPEISEEELDRARDYAKHHAFHVKRADEITAHLDDMTAAARSALRTMSNINDEDWGSDGELSGLDYLDASAAINTITHEIRHVQRIISAFRAEADRQRKLNAEAVKEAASR